MLLWLWLQLKTFSMGSHPPIVRSVHVQPVSAENLNKVRLVVGVEWSSSLDVQLEIKPLPAKLPLLPEALNQAVKDLAATQVGIKDVKVKSQTMITMAPLKAAWPVVRSLQISMLEAPDVDCHITLSEGADAMAMLASLHTVASLQCSPYVELCDGHWDVTSWVWSFDSPQPLQAPSRPAYAVAADQIRLNLVKPWLLQTMSSLFETLVFPEHFVVQLEKGHMVPDVQKPEGVLLLNVLGVDGMPERESFMNEAGAFVTAWTRPRIRHQSDVTWGEGSARQWSSAAASFKMLVHARQYQSLSVQLWQQDNALLGTSHSPLGMATCPLNLLHPGQPQEMELKVNLDNSGPGKKLAAAAGAATAAVAAVVAEMSVARAEGEATRDTVVRVLAHFIPAADVGSYGLDGCGLLNLKLQKVAVPDASVGLLQARAFVTGQKANSYKQVSPAFGGPESDSYHKPTVGVTVSGSNDVVHAQMSEFDTPWDAVYDVIGAQSDLSSTRFVLELVAGAGPGEAKGTIVSRRVAEVPLSTIQARPTPLTPGMSGGDYVLDTPEGYRVRMQLLWNPLVQENVPVAVHSTAVTHANMQELKASIESKQC
ncbi:hypothetical protein QJQ45_022459 [Haematococcus lacustris]|nr:hypothetical protein QJQ45_022459 [Haematococcus lacustris]